MELIFCWILLGVIVIEQVLDGMTTVVALKRKGNFEAGRFMARLFAAIGVIPGLIVSKVVLMIILAAILVYFPSTPYTIALAIIAAMYAAIVANNYRRL